MKFRAFEPIDLRSSENVLSVVQIPLSQIFPDLDQPRKNFQEDTLEELAISIKQYGIIQPIIVKQTAVEQYQIIAGERRWRASKMTGLAVIPAIVRTDKDEDRVTISLIENIQREELNPIELAKAFYRLNKDYNLSHEAIAEMVGKSRTTVTNLLRLLNLAEEVKQLLIENKLEMSHARTLLTLSFEKQRYFARRILKKNMAVRDVEKLVQKYKNKRDEKIKPYSIEVNSWIKQLTDSLASKVAIDINEKGEGRMIIHFSSPSEANCLVQNFTGKIKNF